jgi:single-stranded-DNA-specific exonuclease
VKRGFWQVSPRLSDAQQSSIAQSVKKPVSPLIVQLLSNRGIVTAGQIDLFLSADERLLGDPFLLPDMKAAVERINRALQAKENIAIYGDFDADGITATALLYEGLRVLGGNVIEYVPHRGDEGYGLNNNALSYLAQQGINLVVTVDSGVSAVAEVAEATRLGMDVVVTDHHTVPPELPLAVAVIDPKRTDSAYPFNDLAGVGVAYKLMQAIANTPDKKEWLESFLDLVALGTVADMVSVLGENRYLVKRGLEVLRRTKRVGIKELAKAAGVPISAIDTDTISWVLAPRLNAPGRLDHAGIGFKLLSTDSVEEAVHLAGILENKNAERQRLTESLVAKAKEKIVSEALDLPLIMVGGEDFHSGVVGVVAGKLADEYYRPAVVFERGAEWTRGSARSVPQISIIGALTDCSDLLYRFGGHPMAAGFTVATDKLDELRTRLMANVSAQTDLFNIHPHISIDAEVQLPDLEGDMFKKIQQLAPFGVANQYPTFLARGVTVDDCRCVGSGGGHLKLKLVDGGTKWEAIAFRMGSFASEVTQRLDIVFNLQIDEWRGRAALQLNIIDFAPAI